MAKKSWKDEWTVDEAIECLTLTVGHSDKWSREATRQSDEVTADLLRAQPNAYMRKGGYKMAGVWSKLMPQSQIILQKAYEAYMEDIYGEEWRDYA